MKGLALSNLSLFQGSGLWQMYFMMVYIASRSAHYKKTWLCMCHAWPSFQELKIPSPTSEVPVTCCPDDQPAFAQVTGVYFGPIVSLIVRSVRSFENLSVR